jgi:hypothetical protein
VKTTKITGIQKKFKTQKSLRRITCTYCPGWAWGSLDPCKKEVCYSTLYSATRKHAQHTSSVCYAHDGLIIHVLQKILPGNWPLSSCSVSSHSQTNTPAFLAARAGALLACQGPSSQFQYRPRLLAPRSSSGWENPKKSLGGAPPWPFPPPKAPKTAGKPRISAASGGGLRICFAHFLRSWGAVTKSWWASRARKENGGREYRKLQASFGMPHSVSQSVRSAMT